MKNLPHWLKGGIIGVLVLGILTIILLPFGRPSGIFEFPYWFYPAGIALIPVSLLFKNFITQSPILFFISAILICFIYGAVIGWIYGKIKHKI